MQDEDEKIVIPERLYRNIEADIAALFEKYNISSLPIDVFCIAEKMGYELIGVDTENEFYPVLRDKNIDGITMEKDKKRIIVYRKDMPVARQRFTIAHEIGHIRLGHKEESELADKIANHYAAYLLVPEVLIHATNCIGYCDVVNTFDVSEECANISFNAFMLWMKIKKYRNYEIQILNQFGFVFDSNC